ncbi:MAG: ribbon-helix-helix protein, CopG family [candidate division NC10 bacterium]|nr:ribbon-helix-helix protein, CopG family [Candidatus Methylomirabilis sp.]NJD68937.1 ribbon-helix-helix protein, CopG family [candidate division NC10 bacterium]
MRTLTAHASKSKVTVTISADVVRQLDAILSAPDAGSRSQLVEEALRQWLRDHTRRELEDRVEQYYRSLSEDERTEDRQWSQIAAESAQDLWDQ